MDLSTAAPNLRRWLMEQTTAELAAIQSSWFPDAPLLTNVDQLADRLGTSAGVADMLERLDPRGQAALGRILAAGGSIAAHVLEREFGELPNLTGFVQQRAYLLALARALNPLELLFVRALIFPIRRDHARWYAVPPDLLALLPPVPPAGRLLLHACEPPPEVRIGNPQGCEADLLTMLRLADLGELETLPHGAFNKTSLVKLARQWGARKASNVVSHEAHWPYVRFLRQLASGARFVRLDSDGRLRPAPEFEIWATRLPLDRTRQLLNGWIESEWDELSGLLRYRFQATRRLQPIRLAMLELVRQAPPEEWVAFDAFIGEVFRALPDFARPDGNYAAWGISDTYDRRLNGFEHWQAVEGEWLRQAIGTTLYWLGMVDIGVSDGQLIAFRLNAHGTAILAGEAAPAIATDAPISVQPNFEVFAPPECGPAVRWFLGRIAEPKPQTEGLYRLTQRSVQQALERGVTAPALLQTLAAYNAGPLPPQVEAALWAWVGQYGRVALRRVALLTADDPGILEQIARDPRVRAPELDRLTDTAWVVREADAAALAERLQKHGYGVQSDAFAGNQFNERDLTVIAAALEIYADASMMLGGTSAVSQALRRRVLDMLSERQMKQVLRLHLEWINLIKERLCASESTEQKQ